MLRVVPELIERSAGVDARLLGARTVMAKRRLGLRVELGARCGGSWWWSLPVHTAAHRVYMGAVRRCVFMRCHGRGAPRAVRRVWDGAAGP